MRPTLFALLAATALSTAASAQMTNSPFGAPSMPLTEDELAGIRQEADERKAAARDAAEARAKARDAAAAKQAASVAREKAPDSTSAPAPVSTPAVIEAAPAPVGATTQDTTTVIQPGTAPGATAPGTMAPAAPSAVPAPAPAAPTTGAADPLNPSAEPIIPATTPPSVMEAPTAGSTGSMPAVEPAAAQ